jgi:hypothetical protein
VVIQGQSSEKSNEEGRSFDADLTLQNLKQDFANLYSKITN